METYLQHQRPTDETTFIKVDDFLAVSYYFPYYILLYIYAQRRNKESYFKLFKTSNHHIKGGF